MMIPPDVSTDAAARAAFQASTSQGFGPRAGSVPIGWYQCAHGEAWDRLEAACRKYGVQLPARVTVRRRTRYSFREVFANGIRIGYLSEFQR